MVDTNLTQRVFNTDVYIPRAVALQTLFSHTHLTVLTAFLSLLYCGRYEEIARKLLTNLSRVTGTSIR